MKNHPPHIIKTKSHLFSNADVQFHQLRLIYRRRRIYHHISSAVVFREGDVVTDNLITIQNSDQTVKPKGQPAMRRRAVSKRIHQEAELSLRLFWTKS